MPQFQPHAPETLYKYRSADEKSLKRDLKSLFAQRSLFLATPLDLNDPFDCRPVFGVPSGAAFESALAQHEQHFPPEHRDEVRRRAHILKGSHNHRRAFAEEYYKEDLSKYGVVALSSKRDVPLLWAHYSGNYCGYAVGYPGRDSEEHEALGALAVRYREERPVLNALKDGASEDPLDLFFTKSTAWEHEAEWRHVRSPDNGGVGLLCVPKNAIVELVLGPLIPPDASAALVKAALELDDKPRIVQASLQQERYGLTFERHAESPSNERR